MGKETYKRKQFGVLRRRNEDFGSIYTGINQVDISKLENGTRNPSLNLLKRLAKGMGMTLKLEFIPINKNMMKM